MPDPVNPEVDLVAQYELGDTAPEPIQLVATPEAPAAGAPRDPSTGRFVSPNTTPTTFEHSPYLQRMATDLLDLSDDEIRATSPDSLMAQVAAANRAVLRGRQQAERSDILSDRQSQPTDGRAPQAPPPATHPPEEAFSFEEDNESEQWHPTIKKALSFIQRQDEKIRKLEERLQGTEQREQQRAFTSEAERWDAWFAKYPQTFGEGTGQEMMNDPTQAHFYRKRMAVIREVQATPGNGTREKKAEVARKLLFDQTPAKPTTETPPREPYGTNPDDWRRAGLNRPTQRATEDTLPLGTERAEKNLAKLMKENGLLSADDAAADGFLD